MSNTFNVARSPSHFDSAPILAKKGVLQDEAKVQYAELAITMIEKHGMSS